jgi:hypothetical protein
MEILTLSGTFKISFGIFNGNKIFVVKDKIIGPHEKKALPKAKR